MSKPSITIAVPSRLAVADNLGCLSVEVGLCDTFSPEYHMLCYQSDCYQARRFKKGEAFGTAIEVDCQMLTRRLERGGGTSER